MVDHVEYVVEAEADIAEAYSWYEKREPGLGDDFLRCVQACVQTIQRHPRIFPVIAKDLRHAPIRRFPFEILYVANDSCITISCVFHSAQDPRKWKERLGIY